MADAAVSSATNGGGQASDLEKIKKDLEFVERMFHSAKTPEEYLAAANAASTITDLLSKKSAAQASGAPGAAIVITVLGLPQHSEWNWHRTKRYLTTELGLRVAHVNKQVGSPAALVQLFDHASCNQAMELLGRTQLGGVTLTVTKGEDKQAIEAADAAAGSEGARKRGRNEGPAGGGAGGAAAQKKAPRSSAPLHINEVVCPWWQRPYGEQLQDKYAKVVEALASVTKTAQGRYKQRGPLPEWLQACTTTPAGSAGTMAPAPKAAAGTRPAAPVLGILRSPQLESYRNKNEFTCGHDVDGLPTVGFLLGNVADGLTAVGQTDKTRHTSVVARSYARAMTAFLRQHTTLPPWDKRLLPAQGFWRLLLVRSANSSTFFPAPAGGGGEATSSPATLEQIDPYRFMVQVPTVDEDEAQRQAAHMAPCPPFGPVIPLAEVAEQEQPGPMSTDVLLMVQVNPKYEAVVSNPRLMQQELAAFAKHMRTHALNEGLALTQLVVQQHWGVANMAPADAPLMRCPESEEDLVEAAKPSDAAGDLGCIQERLCELQFRLSPVAFFQVNAAAASVLYRLVGQWAAPTPSTVLFDVCCGTGTIGISMARHVHHVVGVDLVASAIEDAKANAALNNVANVTYECGKAEQVLPALLQKWESSGHELVAVVDPPRAGLHKTVLRTLLACTPLKRVVYVSCNPASLADNLGMLCSPLPPEGRGQARHAHQVKVFTPIKAVAVDLFPHTHHVESVVLLERE